MKSAAWILAIFFLSTNAIVFVENTQHSQADQKIYPNPIEISIPDRNYNPVANYEGEPDDDAEMRDVMVPIPMKDRIPNKTGIQCVWSSIETLARYADFERLFDMTEKPECRSYSGPSSAGRWLKSHNVKFEQTTGGDRSLIIKGVVEEKRGVLFDVPGHAMVLVHYDEDKGIVKYINNSDRSLKIRTWTMSEFNRRFGGWVLLIYADNDIIGRSPARDIPILDKNNPQKKYPDDYIPIPQRIR